MVVIWTKTDPETPGVAAGCTVAACGTIVDGAWNTSAFTGRMTAWKDEYTFSRMIIRFQMFVSDRRVFQICYFYIFFF